MSCLNSCNILFRSEGVGEIGLAAANKYFKEQEIRLNEQIAELKQAKFDLEKALKEITGDRDSLQQKVN